MIDDLFKAIRNNNIDLVEKLLIEHDDDVNAEDDDGNTPLHEAASNNNIEIAKLLIEHGANVNAEADDCRTPLHEAASNNSTEMAKLLIEHGANLNAEADDRRTPLREAASNNNIEIAKLLIEHGANTIDDIFGRTPEIPNSPDDTMDDIFGCTPEIPDSPDDTIDDIFGRTPEIPDNPDNTMDDIFGCTPDRSSKRAKPIENWVKPQEYRKKWRKRVCLIVIGIFAVHFFAGVLEGINNSSKMTEAKSFKATKTLNCRDQAGTNGKVIGKIAGGHSVFCSKIEGKWCRTVCNGKEGFVYKKFLSK